MVEEKFEELKAKYFSWVRKQETECFYPCAEAFFAQELYNCLVDLQRRKYNATNEEIGRFVRMANDFTQLQFKLSYYRYELIKISLLSEPRRTMQLSQLMDGMQREYKIPLLNDEGFNKNNVEVMRLYRDISNARDL